MTMCFSSLLHDRISEGLVIRSCCRSDISHTCYMIGYQPAAAAPECDTGLRDIPHVMALGLVCARSSDTACAIIDRAAWSAT